MGLKTDLFADYEAFLMRKKKPGWCRIMGLFFRSSGFTVVVCYRIGHRFRRRGHRILGGLFERLEWRCGASISVGAEIGKGLRIPHPIGIVIGSGVKIGERAWILQGVTLGGEGNKVGEGGQTSPHLGDNVLIGAGAKILGPVLIGNGVKIGANAVVNRDLPDDCTAVGIPARIIKVEGEKVGLLDHNGELAEKLNTIFARLDELDKRTGRLKSDE